MNEVPILFTQKWKIGISLVVILALTFLDKITPPFGIPIAVLGVFVLFRWRKLPIYSDDDYY